MFSPTLWLPLSLTAIFLWTLIPVQGFDIWFYLEIGRSVAVDHHIPWSESYLGSTDEFAFRRHANHAWLSSTIYFLFYKAFGMAGLVLVRSLVITGTAFVTYLNCRLLKLEPAWSAILIMLGVWTVRSRFLLRSSLFTDLFMAILLYLLLRTSMETEDSKFPYWKLVLLFVLWTNTHQGVVVGCVCLFLWLFTRQIPWKTRILALTAAGLSVFVRPMGWWYPLMFLETFGNTAAMSGVSEWTPLSGPQVFQHLGPMLILTGLVLAVVLKEKKVPWGDLLFGLAFLGLALRSQRAVAEMLPIFTPVLASLLYLAKPSRRLLPIGVLIMGALYYQAWMGVSPERLTKLDPKYPEGLVSEMPKDHGQVFNSYEFGNYLLFKDKSTFIHGMTALYREPLVLEFHNILNGPNRDELLERFRVREVLIHHPTSNDSTDAFLTYLDSSKDWKLHWWDDSGYYFRKDETARLQAVKPWTNPPWSDREAAIKELDQMLEHRPSGLAYYLRAQLFLEEKKTQEALGFLDKSLEITPLYYPALLARGTTAYQLNNFEDAEKYLKKAVQVNPWSELAKFNLALLYLQQGRSDKAKKLLLEAAQLNPNFRPAVELLQKL